MDAGVGRPFRALQTSRSEVCARPPFLPFTLYPLAFTLCTFACLG